jgi:hypothetical protein
LAAAPPAFAAVLEEEELSDEAAGFSDAVEDADEGEAGEDDFAAERLSVR